MDPAPGLDIQKMQMTFDIILAPGFFSFFCISEGSAHGATSTRRKQSAGWRDHHRPTVTKITIIKEKKKSRRQRAGPVLYIYIYIYQQLSVNMIKNLD